MLLQVINASHLVTQDLRMPEQGVSDLEKQTAAHTVGKVDAADPSLAADRLGVRIQRDGFDRPFAGTKSEPEAEKVGNAEAFRLLLQVGLVSAPAFSKVELTGMAMRTEDSRARTGLNPNPYPRQRMIRMIRTNGIRLKKRRVIHILHRPLAAELESLVPGTALEAMINGILFLKSFPCDLPWSA